MVTYAKISPQKWWTPEIQLETQKKFPDHFLLCFSAFHCYLFPLYFCLSSPFAIIFHSTLQTVPLIAVEMQNTDVKMSVTWTFYQDDDLHSSNWEMKKKGEMKKCHNKLQRAARYSRTPVFSCSNPSILALGAASRNGRRLYVRELESHKWTTDIDKEDVRRCQTDADITEEAAGVRNRHSHRWSFMK